MKPGIFIETENVQRFRVALSELRDHEVGQPGLMVAWGRAGRGKTLAAQNSYAKDGGVYCRVWEGLTQAQFLARLYAEVVGTEAPHTALKCKEGIIRRLETDPQTIFMDEADRLALPRLEDLRDIHDETGCPVILIGEEGTTAKLAARRRIWSRVTQEVEFKPITEDDAGVFAAEAAGLQLEPSAAMDVIRRTEGDFRLVRNEIAKLESAAQASGTTVVSLKMSQQLGKRAA